MMNMRKNVLVAALALGGIAFAGTSHGGGPGASSRARGTDTDECVGHELVWRRDL